jgi:hypothetical protein
MSGLRVIALATLIVAPGALAESIYVCRGSDGAVVYRDFPCPPGSEATTVVGPTTADTKSAKAASLPKEHQLRAGMSRSEVRAILGSPSEITQEEGVDGRVDTWSYGNSRTVQFDAGGRLVK